MITRYLYPQSLHCLIQWGHRTCSNPSWVRASFFTVHLSAIDGVSEWPGSGNWSPPGSSSQKAARGWRGCRQVNELLSCLQPLQEVLEPSPPLWGFWRLYLLEAVRTSQGSTWAVRCWGVGHGWLTPGPTTVPGPFFLPAPAPPPTTKQTTAAQWNPLLTALN